jgi:hypothetical protein
VLEAGCHHQRHKEADYGTGKDHASKSNDPINPRTVMDSQGREETVNAAYHGTDRNDPGCVRVESHGGHFKGFSPSSQ